MLAKARKRFAQTCNDIGMPLTIASLRLRSGLSQTKVAMLLGNSQSSYSLIEVGQREMLYKTFEKLVDIFQVSRDELAQAIKNTKTLAQDSSK
jgi:transcriptional regulator with XRE-family HTH domain